MKTIQERLIEEYLGIQKEPKEENTKDRTINPYRYENDPILQSLRNRYLELKKFGYEDSGKQNLLDYLKRTYPDKIDLEAF